jgi:hypothetical protein
MKLSDFQCVCRTIERQTGERALIETVLKFYKLMAVPALLY